jgi:hypothetical protein
MMSSYLRAAGGWHDSDTNEVGRAGTLGALHAGASAVARVCAAPCAACTALCISLSLSYLLLSILSLIS